MNGPRPVDPTVDRSERGIALVVALLALLVISSVAVVMLTSVHTGTKVSGHNLRVNQALNVAEAGISEAMARLSIGDAMSDGDPPNPQLVTQIFLSAPGNVPVLSGDSIALATSQPAVGALRYSTPARGPEVLTIEYKTDSARSQVYRYDLNKNPPVNVVTGYPIYRITSVGRVGADLRRVVTEVIHRPVTGRANAAFQADVGVNFSGNSAICGYNHRADTPSYKGKGGRSGNDGCNENPGMKQWETGVGNAPGVWSSGNVSTGGSSQRDGDPPILDNQAGFFAGPWEAMTMSQAEFFSWMGTPYSSEVPGAAGILYLDNNGVTQDASGDFRYNGGDGSGFLYVDGDLAINGNFTYRGVIYVEGDLKINGTCWILGALIVKGKVPIKIANGTCTVLYSREAIEQNIAKYGNQFVTISWKDGL